jgi:putative hemolysin
MSTLAVEIVIVLCLLIANGVFAMSEIAVVSARKPRLQQRAEEGSRGARRALELANAPDRFLATVQVGITGVGVLTGAFGGATLAAELAAVLRRSATLAPYADGLSLGLVVLAITYASLIIGELVPKRIGLNSPERIAAAVAGPMNFLSRAAAPLVWLLSASTRVVLRILQVHKSRDLPVTEAEISVLLEQGTQAGVFEAGEQEMVERVFRLGDQRVVGVMTPRHRLVWLDADAPAEENQRLMREHAHSRYLVCEGDLDAVLGVVEVKDLWNAVLCGGETTDLRTLLHQPLFVPESTRALRLLEKFRETGNELALVVDEYGGIDGLVTLANLLEEVAGELGPADCEPGIVQREDGSLLVDGAVSMDELREWLGLEERRSESREYRTVGGFVFTEMGRVPRAGDHVVARDWRLEVVDMDGNRIDKVLISPLVELPREMER